MTVKQPITELDARYSADGVGPTDWAVTRERLQRAELYWVTTVRPDGRPHVTPLIGVWLDDALHFSTGPEERKARNLEGNSQCVLTTGCNALGEGLDVVVEGAAVRVTDGAKLQRIADEYETKYGSEWHFDVADGKFHHDGGGGQALVFEVAPSTVYSFGKGEYSHTRHRF